MNIFWWFRELIKHTLSRLLSSNRNTTTLLFSPSTSSAQVSLRGFNTLKSLPPFFGCCENVLENKMCRLLACACRMRVSWRFFSFFLNKKRFNRYTFHIPCAGVREKKKCFCSKRKKKKNGEFFETCVEYFNIIIYLRNDHTLLLFKTTPVVRERKQFDFLMTKPCGSDSWRLRRLDHTHRWLLTQKTKCQPPLLFHCECSDVTLTNSLTHFFAFFKKILCHFTTGARTIIGGKKINQRNLSSKDDQSSGPFDENLHSAHPAFGEGNFERERNTSKRISSWAKTYSCALGMDVIFMLLCNSIN